MYYLSKKVILPLLAIALLIVASVACGGGTTTPTQAGQATNPPASMATAVQVQPTPPPEPTNTPKPTLVPPTATPPPEPTNTPKPTPVPPTATPPPVGLSRSNPYPRSELVAVPNWDVRVLEVKRGEEAWKDIQAANMFNEAAPEGMEYLLVKLHVKSTYTDSDEHSISGCDFAVTGDRLIRYTCDMATVVEPEPQLDARLFTGGEAEGWSAYLVAQGEGNLILVVDEILNLDESAIRYIALDEGATISILPELASIKPTDLGKDRNNPASPVDKIITEDWEVSVIEVVRGDEAWKMVQEANQFNDPPAEGLEYIAVKIHVRYIGTEDKAENISGIFFKTTGNAGVLYDPPLFVVGPDPSLNIWLYSGGEYEGWIVVQAAKDETGVMLVFDPPFDFSGKNRRFISLGP